MMDYQKMCEAADYMRPLLPEIPKVGLILGSGLGDLGEKLEEPRRIIPYGEIPGFVCSTAPGHKGRFICGRLSGVPVLCMQGRLHCYEGHDITEVVLPVQVMRLLGVETLILTNAAGGVNLDFKVGDLMLLEDHINFMGRNPLIGKNAPEMGPRFCDMSYTYTPALRKLALEAAQRLGISLRRGVYLATTGPSFETPAEIRAFRTLGADAVGMSTVPEAIAASHCGMKVLAFSLITNMAAGILDQPLTEEEVIEIGQAKGQELQKLVLDILAHLPQA